MRLRMLIGQNTCVYARWLADIAKEHCKDKNARITRDIICIKWRVLNECVDKNKHNFGTVWPTEVILVSLESANTDLFNYANQIGMHRHIGSYNQRKYRGFFTL